MVIQRTPSTTIRLLRLASHTKLIFALYITNFLVCTTLFMLLEHKSFGDSLWWCTVTWFTVGYGDLYPLSGYGRLFGMYVIISSHIFIVLLTANVVAKLSQYRAEAALEEERRMHKQSRPDRAIAVIKRSHRQCAVRRRQPIDVVWPARVAVLGAQLVLLRRLDGRRWRADDDRQQLRRAGALGERDQLR
jgi:voltage-gated potassium channel